jgi:hypothetical protein
MTPGFSAPQGPEIFFIAVLFTVVASLVGVARKILVAGSKLAMSMADPLEGAVGRSSSGHHQSW